MLDNIRGQVWLMREACGQEQLQGAPWGKRETEELRCLEESRESKCYIKLTTILENVPMVYCFMSNIKYKYIYITRYKNNMLI